MHSKCVQRKVFLSHFFSLTFLPIRFYDFSTSPVHWDWFCINIYTLILSKARKVWFDPKKRTSDFLRFQKVPHIYTFYTTRVLKRLQLLLPDDNVGIC